VFEVFEPHPLCPPLLIKERGISIKKEGRQPLLNTCKDEKPMFLTVLEKI